MKNTLTLLVAIIAVAFTSHAQNTWIQKANFPGTGVSERKGAVGFSIGNKGYIGAGSADIYRKDFWEYDPVANTWTQKADFGGTKRSAAVGFSIDGKGYVGTGVDMNNWKKDFWQYDPITNIWTQKSNFGGTGRRNAVGFSINGKGYTGTGVFTNDFWEYDPVADTWTQKANFGGTGRDAAVGFSIGSKGYIGTGWATDSIKSDFWEYDPVANTWTQKANFKGGARYQAVGFSIGSKGYIGTGMDTSYSFEKDFWEYDLSTNNWTQKADLGGSARVLAVGFSIGSKGYLGTGTGGGNDFWEYTPDSICTTPTAEITPLGNLDICNSGFAKLQASSGNNYTYQWIRNNVDLPGATNQIFKAKNTGNYKVRISTGPGCSAVSKKTVVYSSCKLGEEDELNSSLNLYPNPTTGTFTLNLKLNDEENSQAIIQVLNMLGQVVYDETTSVANGALQKEIQLSDAAADGMYLVKVTIDDRVYTAQINLQK